MLHRCNRHKRFSLGENSTSGSLGKQGKFGYRRPRSLTTRPMNTAQTACSRTLIQNHQPRRTSPSEFNEPAYLARFVLVLYRLLHQATEENFAISQMQPPVSSLGLLAEAFRKKKKAKAALELKKLSLGPAEEATCRHQCCDASLAVNGLSRCLHCFCGVS